MDEHQQPPPGWSAAYHPQPVPPAQRKERPGLGLGLAAVGSVTTLVALFLPWARVWLQAPYGERRDEETAGIFSLVDVVEEVTDGARRAPSGGVVADLFFPVLAIALTVVCCLVALLAAFGLRRKGLTNTLRVVGTLVVGGTMLVALAALFQLGAGFFSDYSATATVRTADEEARGRADMVSQVITHYGFWVWVGGAGLLVLATMLGPRVRYRLADGTEVVHPSLAVSAWSGAMPGQAAPAYGIPASGQSAHGHAGISPMMAPGMIPLAFQTLAAALGGLGALLCLAGYAFLPWAADTTFGDISGAVRDHGIDDHPLAAAYFGWAGWVLLLGALVAALLLVMGRRPLRFRPASVRPVLLVGTVVAALFHLAAMIDGEVFEDLDVGSLSVTVGIAMVLVGSLLPLRPLLPTRIPGPGPR